MELSNRKRGKSDEDDASSELDKHESTKSSSDEDLDENSDGAGDGESDSESNSNVEDDESADEEEVSNLAIRSSDIEEKLSLPEGVEKCSFDLKNLTAINSFSLDPNKLYTSSTDSTNRKIVNEEYLVLKSSEACQQLVAAIWSLPREASQDAGPLAILPAVAEIKTPRALPPPPPKVETKWEKFAKERGLPSKNKRERKVFDEATGEWMYRHGYQRANKKDKEWPIMEVKRGTDPFEDPWVKEREAKRARLDKNLESRMRNQERAGMIPRGSAKKLLKDKESAREKGKEGGLKGVQLPPSGLPVDLKTGKSGGETRNTMKRGKELTKQALLATQRSTASMGKFDKMLEGEPERKSAIRRRQFDATTPSSSKMKSGSSSKETTRQTKVLENVLNGGAKQDKMKRNGLLAKGETAYDFDYKDSLGPSTFRKKKGRAGAGKMRKVTKKRIK